MRTRRPTRRGRRANAVWLVDTSLWIATFRRGGPALESLVPFDEVVTVPPVIQEVLQGFGDTRSFAVARDAMLALPIIDRKSVV